MLMLEKALTPASALAGWTARAGRKEAGSKRRAAQQMSAVAPTPFLNRLSRKANSPRRGLAWIGSFEVAG